MAHYTFEIIKCKLATDRDDHIDRMPLLTVESNNYIEATFKVQKRYPSDKYTHRLIDTDAEHWPDDTSIF